MPLAWPNTRKLSEAALTANAKIFATYGHYAGTVVGASIFLTLTLGLTIGLSIGQKEVTYETELSNLWIEKGSRAEDENKILDKYFGGESRISQLVLSLTDARKEPNDDNDAGVLTKETIYLMGNLTKPLLFETGVNKLTVNLKLADDTFADVELSNKDFCDRPPVNPFLEEWASLNPLVTAYNHPFVVGGWLSAETAGSGALHYLSNCLGARAKTELQKFVNATTNADYVQLQFWYKLSPSALRAVMNAQDTTEIDAIAASRAGLPIGWGIDRFPCTRALINDCWSNGGFDYPARLVQLGDYAYSLTALSDPFITQAGLPNLLKLVVNGGVPGPAKTWYEQCKADLTTSIDSTVAVLYASTPSVIPFAQAQAQSAVTTAIAGAETLYGAGYWWRPSIEDQASTLASSFFESMENVATHTAAECVAEGLFRQISAVRQILSDAVIFSPLANLGISYSAITAMSGGCCSNWAGIRITPLLFVGQTVPEDPTSVSTSLDTGRFAFGTRLSHSALSSKSIFMQSRFKSELGLADDAVDADSLLKIARDWEQLWIDELEPKQKRDVGSGFEDNDITLDFIVERSTGDLLTDAADVQPHLLIAGYIALIAFSCFNFIDWACPPTKESFVYSRSLLCFLGMLLVGFSTLASFGFMGWVGMKLSPLNSMLVPFLAVGMGLCDLFVLIHQFDHHSSCQDNVRQRIALTMADAGSSITVTNAANAVAFLIPAGIVKLPAIYTFSYHMAAAIILNWIVVIFAIVPLAFFDGLRSRAKRSIIAPCIRAEGQEMDTSMKADHFSLSHLVEHHLCPLYRNVIFKIFTMCLFLGATAFLGWYGFTKAEKGLVLYEVAIKGSYVRNFLRMQHDNFPLLPGSIVYKSFTDEDGNRVDLKDFQPQIRAILDEIDSDYIDPVNSPASLHWLPSLVDFYNEGTGATNNTIPPENFYATLQSWLGNAGRTSISDFACIDATTEELLEDCSSADGTTVLVAATTGSAYYKNIDKDVDYVKAIEEIRNKADESSGNQYNGEKVNPSPLFFTGSLFRYWQQYVGIQDTTLRTVGYSMLGVFGAVFFFQFNLLSSLLVGCMLLATVVQLYGFMVILGVKLNGFSMLNLSIAVGLGVELSAYVSYSYLRQNAKTNDPDERMTLAVTEMFSPMFQGSMTGFISVIVLAFAKYPFFSLYYFQMVSMMILLAFLNGIWWLPIVLSIVNPVGLDKVHREQSLGADAETKGAGAKFVDDDRTL